MGKLFKRLRSVTRKRVSSPFRKKVTTPLKRNVRKFNRRVVRPNKSVVKQYVRKTFNKTKGIESHLKNKYKNVPHKLFKQLINHKGARRALVVGGLAKLSLVARHLHNAVALNDAEEIGHLAEEIGPLIEMLVV